MSILLEERELVANKPLDLVVILTTRFCLEKDDAIKLIEDGAVLDAEGEPHRDRDITVKELRGMRILLDQLQPAIDHHFELSRKRMATPIPHDRLEA